MKRFLSLSILLLVMASCAAWAQVDIKPAVATEAVEVDADDPAIWVNRRDPAQSLILGTDKGGAEIKGALYVFGLDGKIRQKIAGLDKPNNVDVEYGFRLGDRRIDIAVLTEANARRLRVYEITPAGRLIDISGDRTVVFSGEPRDQTRPMGISLYKRPGDGAVYAIVSRALGPTNGYLAQYLLKDDGSGKVEAVQIRRFGGFSGEDCIEAVAVDDELGYVYYADESTCIRKYHADPDHPAADKELAAFGVSEYERDREGIAIYTLADGTGYVICTDQTGGNSRYLIYPREGSPGKPHDHGKALKTVRGGAQGTDGIDAVSIPLGSQFPNGILVVMNSTGRNFLIYDWRTVAQTGKPRLSTR